MPDDLLSQTVTVYDDELDEYRGIDRLAIRDDTGGVLDEPHAVLIMPC